MTDDQNKVVEEPVVEETEPVVEEPVKEEPVVEEEAKPATKEPAAEEGSQDPEYKLEDIKEYVELKQQYDELTAKFDTLTADYDALKTQNSDLQEFKAQAEKKEKEEMINSFYMLSEDDKKDVVDNIDTYSLEDIESKLSILCVRNKVSFDLDNDKNKQEPISYNLNDEGSAGNDVPEWIKAIQTHVAEN